MTDPSAARPVIGLTAYVEAVDRGVWTAQRSVVLPHDYVAKIEGAGGIAVVLPPRGDVTDHLAQELLARVDGLVVTGGADVESATYGQDPHPCAQEARPARDRSELALVRVARRVGMPLLGICRGMQIMAVEAGGTLEQHVPDRVGHEEHSPRPGVFGRHGVDLMPGSRMADLLGGHVDVHSYHHQAVATHPGYAAVGHAPDGTIEAIESIEAIGAMARLDGIEGSTGSEGDTGSGGNTGIEAPFCVGVQWHPEPGDDDRLFVALVSAARRFGRAGRAD